MRSLSSSRYQKLGPLAPQEASTWLLRSARVGLEREKRLAEAEAELVIEPGAAGHFDELVFVEGADAGGGGLAADPGGLFGEANLMTTIGGAEGRAEAAHASAGDEELAGPGWRVGGNFGGFYEGFGISGDADSFDVDVGVGIEEGGEQEWEHG
jgi:hypothetical protein